MTDVGLDVIIVEVRGRVGGRTAEGSLPSGEVINHGAEWMGTEHERVLNLVKTFDLDLCEQYDVGKDRITVTGELFDHEKWFRALPPEWLC